MPPPPTSKQHFEQQRELIRALLSAAEQDDLQGVRAVPDCLEYRDGNGAGIIHACCRGGAIHVLEWILTVAPTQAVLLDMQKRSPLTSACSHANAVECVKRLLHVEQVKTETMELAQDGDGARPLHLAASCSVESTKALLDAGANPNSSSSTGTPLHWTAAHASTDELAIEVTNLLLSRGADVNANAPGEGTTPLILACFRSNVPLVKTLLTHGADPAAVANNVTPLIAAAAISNSLECARELLRIGGNDLAKQRDPVEKLLPVEHAAHAENVEMMELLLPISGFVDNNNVTIASLLAEAKERDAKRADVLHRAKQEAEQYKEAGNALFVQQKLSEAIVEYMKGTSVLDAPPAVVAALWSNISACQLKLKRLDEAKAAAIKAIHTDPTFVKAKFRLGQVEAARGDHTAAADAYWNAYSMDKNGADANSLMACFRKEFELAKQTAR